MSPQQRGLNSDLQISVSKKHAPSIGRSYHAKLASELIKQEKAKNASPREIKDALSPSNFGRKISNETSTRLNQLLNGAAGGTSIVGGASAEKNAPPILHVVDTISETEEMQS